MGSSPPVRGYPRPDAARPALHGFIPARAGLPRSPGRRTSWVWVHPRPRGAAPCPPPLRLFRIGSSPPARGRLLHLAQHWSGARFLPARPGTLCLYRPRSSLRFGSSPPVRSCGPHVPFSNATRWFIPARAGPSTRPTWLMCPWRAHPRPCGADLSLRGAEQQCGSSRYLAVWPGFLCLTLRPGFVCRKVIVGVLEPRAGRGSVGNPWAKSPQRPRTGHALLLTGVRWKVTRTNRLASSCSSSGSVPLNSSISRGSFA